MSVLYSLLSQSVDQYPHSQSLEVELDTGLRLVLFVSNYLKVTSN